MAKAKKRDKYSLGEIDLCRKLGILYFTDEDSEEDDCHISDVSIAHNFMCDYCEHFLSREDGFVLIPLSKIKDIEQLIEMKNAIENRIAKITKGEE